ncbi:hypothetical protein [Hydrotalea sp.]|uniref:hypothetical protein n=1 Tax=Hydrotalea sp. TaxID=2881279 RepID=UPI003D0FE3AD
MAFVWAAIPVQAQLGGGLGLGNPLGGGVNNRPMNGGQQRYGIGNSRLQISNGISNGAIGLSPDPTAPGNTITPITGTNAPTIGTFGSPGGGGPGSGGNPPGGGYFSAPLDGGAIILIVLGLGFFLQLRLREYKKDTHLHS